MKKGPSIDKKKSTIKSDKIRKTALICLIIYMVILVFLILFFIHVLKMDSTVSMTIVSSICLVQGIIYFIILTRLFIKHECLKPRRSDGIYR